MNGIYVLQESHKSHTDYPFCIIERYSTLQQYHTFTNVEYIFAQMFTNVIRNTLFTTALMK